MSRNLNLPYFPVAPEMYNRAYFNELTRSFSVYIQQIQNPGEALFTKISMSNVPEYANNAAALAGDLAVGDVYKTSTGELRIVV